MIQTIAFVVSGFCFLSALAMYFRERRLKNIYDQEAQFYYTILVNAQMIKEIDFKDLEE